ncbi:MAG: hypothetical protein EXX96DRAFT_235325 [Benjaminiella poitrasii]|nr:MAG: hypothetical protein EXX96DRAFT_235325 [Benjaminiella poitrasii]
MILLLAIALFCTTAVEPANATQLDISEEQAPLLLKNALHLTTAADHSGIAVYRPYSIFGEQLSHISEEDQSVLDRMLTTEESVRRMDSYDSVARTPSFYSESGLYYSYSRQQQFLSQQQQFLSQQQQQQQLQGDEYNNYQSMTLVPTVPANALALLPISISPLDPLVAFTSCFIFKSDDEDDIQEDYPQIITTKLNYWQKHTLTLTLIILGVGFGLMNTFLFVYLYSSLEISIAMISCLIMAHMTSEMIVACVIEKWFIHKLNLTLATTLGHITLILCAILYPCLKSNSIITQVSLLILQALQASSFQLLWLSGSDQVILIHWNPLDRMKHRVKLSAAYSSIGLAIGCLLAGFILLEDSTLIYKICVALFSLSFVVSWGWTSEE